MGPLDMPFAIDAYDALPPSILRFNPPYYHALLKDAGFETERGFVDYRITVRPRAGVALGERGHAAGTGLPARAAARRSGGSSGAPPPSLFNETFAAHWGMSPVTEDEQATYLGLFEATGAFDTSVIAYRGDEPVGQVTVVPETQRIRVARPRPRRWPPASGSTGSASACVRRRVAAA